MTTKSGGKNDTMPPFTPTAASSPPPASKNGWDKSPLSRPPLPRQRRFYCFSSPEVSTPVFPPVFFIPGSFPT